MNWEFIFIQGMSSSSWNYSSGLETQEKNVKIS